MLVGGSTNICSIFLEDPTTGGVEHAAKQTTLKCKHQADSLMLKYQILYTISSKIHVFLVESL